MGKIVVVYGGGFQPFHAGHFSSYIQAKEKFGKFPNTEFYVTASDNTNTRPIPFKEKQWLAKQAGVSEQDFRNVAVKSPLNPVEILSQYNPDQDIFILVRSERDPVAYNRKDGTPGYYQPFVNINKCKPFNGQAGGHGYVFVTQKEEFNLAGQTVYSGTQVRNMYASADNEMRNRIVKDMYPNSPNELMIRKVLDKYIGATDAQSLAPKTNDTVVKPKSSAIDKLKAKKLSEQIQRIRPLLKEANPVQKYKFLKLMKESLGQIVGKEFLDGHQRSKLLMKLLDTGKYDLSDLELLTSAELVELYREEFKKVDEISFFNINKPKEPLKNKETSPNDYHSYFNKPETKKQKIYHGPEEYVSKTKLDPITGKKVVDEFASPGGDDSGPDEEEILFRLAKQWWLGNEQDMIRAERTLASMGWEIGEDEGYDDGGVFVVRAGDVNGKSYISWPHEDLIVDEGQTSDMRDFFKTQQPLNTAPIKPTTTGPTIATVTRQSEGINEISDETLQSYLGKADRHVSNRLDRMSQARERLNKNYEIYDVENPSRIIDRFEANSPELARQYFEKFIKEYHPGDSDFHFEVRRSTGIIENRIIYAGSKVNLVLVYKQKPILLTKEPVDYTDENIKKYAIVAYLYLRDTTGKKFSIQSIMRAIIVKPLEVHQTNEDSSDYLEEK